MAEEVKQERERAKADNAKPDFIQLIRNGVA